MKKLLSAILVVTLFITCLPANPVSATNTTQVPDDAVEFNGHYYKVYVDANIGWHDAKTVCEELNGHLATIASKEENDFVFSLVQDKNIQCWLGATDEEIEGIWKWVTGEEFSFTNCSFDNRGGKQHYLVINYTDDGLWDDQGEKAGGSFLCKTGGYVCEWEPKENIMAGKLTGDIIEFGSYPQSKVTDETLLSNLNKLKLEWKSYVYYSGNDVYGSMVQGDWMKYADVIYGGNKYRAVTFSHYRPVSTYYSFWSNCTNQDNNEYSTNIVYWFKYEPLRWRVLDAGEGLVMCENIIDSQAYSNIIYSKSGSGCYNNSSCTTYANNYATSSIREWLNDDFYNISFTNNEKSQIGIKTLNNSCWSSSYPEYDSVTTNDKIFLLSFDEVINSEYGFSSLYYEDDMARITQGTDYAKCQGLDVNKESSYRGASRWWLRSSGRTSNIACVVYERGHIYDDCTYVDHTEYGIRPALCLNLDNSNDDDIGTENPTSKRKTKVFVNKETLNFFEDEDIVFVVAEEEDGKYYTPEKITVSNSDESILSLQSIYNYHQFKSLSQFSDFEVPAEYQNGKFIVMTARKTGMSIITINNNLTKDMYTFPISVAVDDYISLRADKIPTYDYKIPQLLVDDEYNAYYNGMYIADLAYKQVSGGWIFDMNIYNTTHACGVVEVYDDKGNLINAKKIEKFEDAGTGLMETLETGWNMLTEIFTWDSFSFRGVSFSKETKIKNLYVPQDGYVKITNDSAVSTMCFVLNLFDAVLTGASMIKDVWNFTSSEIGEIENTLLGEFVKNEYYLKFASKYQEKLTKKAFESITEASFASTVATLAGEANGLLMEIDLDFDDIVKTALGTTVGIGEGILLKYADIFGFTLNTMFTAQKVLNYIVQLSHWTKTCGNGTPFGFVTPFVSSANKTLYSGDKIGVDTNGNVSPEVILQTYRVLKDTITVELEKGELLNDFIAYDISLVKDGKITQPNGKVKVYIPFPAEFEGSNIQMVRQEEDGSWSLIDSVVKNGVITFEVDHFCVFAIVRTGKVSSVSVNDLTMTYKKTTNLDMEINADDDAIFDFEYSSSNPSIATVDENGNVTATGTGEAEITVTVTDEYGNVVEDTCTVTVSYAWWQWFIIIFLFGWIWY